MIMALCGVALIEGPREYDLGLSVVQAAVDANPNYPVVVTGAGVAHLICGDLDEALRLFHRVTHLGPGDPGAHFALCGIAHIHLLRGNHEEALAWAKRAFATNSNFHPTLWLLIAANAHLGRTDAAKIFLERLQEGAPGVTIASIRRGQVDKDPSRLEPVLEGLRLAGLPEGTAGQRWIMTRTHVFRSGTVGL
jgi:tetratricopeptide (TPR) repeat protein